ncbi:hypothetical protein [Brasilonema bromeliae]|uniref:hypothetical protein n=1 Tax=Brasilonema bromeliae TaxID=383615 RepID=UPI0030DA8074
MVLYISLSRISTQLHSERQTPTEGERHMLQAGKPVQRSGSPPAVLAPPDLFFNIYEVLSPI